jgi:hypothetical protein
MFGLGKKKTEIEEAEEKEAKIIKAAEKENPEDVKIVTQAPKEVSEEEAKDTEPSQEDSKEEIPPLTYKEMKALKKSRYEKIASKFNKAYVLKNKRTGQIVEIRAINAFHACNIIGWKKNKVKVLEEKDVENEDGQ